MDAARASLPAATPRAAEIGITRAIVAEVERLTDGDLPDEALEAARHCVLDWFGVAIAGADEPLVCKLLAEAREQGGKPSCTVVWHGERTSATFATLINGSAADALDFADAHLAMRGHTTPAVVAASLALAESRRASGLEFLTAVVAGIETECRVGLAVNPDLRRGFHPTGNLAPFGAAAAASRLLGLDRERRACALGIAATQSAGLLASGGTMCKPFHSGKAAANGVLAASLAARDFVGRPDAIEAEEGFIATHANARHEDEIDAARGRYLVMEVIFKSHAACQLTHSSIENLLKLKREHGFDPGEVERVELVVPRSHLSVCNIQDPKTALEAKFSLRGTAAMALLGDDTRDIHAYNAGRVAEPQFVRLRDRVHVSARDDLTGGKAIARLLLADGRELSSTLDAYRPLRDLPRQRAILTDKFRRLVTPVLGDSRTSGLLEFILRTDRLGSVTPLIDGARRAAHDFQEE